MKLYPLAIGIGFCLCFSTVFSWVPESSRPKTYQTRSLGSILKATPHATNIMSSASTPNELLATGTLAADFRIAMSISKEAATFSLYPLNGMSAKGALSNAPLGDPSITISCLETASQVLGMQVSHNDDTVKLNKDLILTLEIILLQNFLKHHSANRETWQIAVGEKEGLKVSDFAQGQKGVEDLFSLLVEDTSVEWVEMVTGSGNVLGRVPRPLVHKYNLLHRGIGMFVTKDQPMMVDSQPTFPPLYTHQRTATKRIFPSLYDMFVGGVSLAGESSELTARREVAEELGLSRALEFQSSLSEPILDCLVCTHLNRCFVTLYSYTMDTEKETVSWQEEEVAWGDFVEYPVIAAAADLSIQRLDKQNAWPGTHPPIQSDLRGVAPKDVAYNNDDWKKWDFVPDGLLVWEAWLEYLQKEGV